MFKRLTGLLALSAVLSLLAPANGSAQEYSAQTTATFGAVSVEMMSGSIAFDGRKTGPVLERY
ncbi:MAG: hypothetical protein HKN29_08195 [Rhodothermales bacterium]|nr:hypothetical protein [Rhodothermales bacterium]